MSTISSSAWNLFLQCTEPLGHDFGRADDAARFFAIDHQLLALAVLLRNALFDGRNRLIQAISHLHATQIDGLFPDPLLPCFVSAQITKTAQRPDTLLRFLTRLQSARDTRAQPDVRNAR